MVIVYIIFRHVIGAAACPNDHCVLGDVGCLQLALELAMYRYIAVRELGIT